MGEYQNRENTHRVDIGLLGGSQLSAERVQNVQEFVMNKEGLFFLF